MTSNEEKLVLDNMKLAYKLANSYYGRYVNRRDIKFELTDLQSIAFIGLIKAAKTFDISLNIKFVTYAYKCISTELNNYIFNNMKYIGIVSIQTPLDDTEDITIEDMIVSDINIEEEVTTKIQYENLYKCIDELNDRHRQIVLYRLQGLTFNQIGEKLGYTQPLICLEYNRAINTLRTKLINRKEDYNV